MTPWQDFSRLAAVPENRDRFDITSPIDGSLVGRLPTATADDVRAAAGATALKVCAP